MIDTERDDPLNKVGHSGDIDSESSEPSYIQYDTAQPIMDITGDQEDNKYTKIGVDMVQF